VSVDDLKRAVSLADPEIDNAQLDKLMCWAFKTTTDKLYETDQIDLTQMLDRLQNGNLHRAGRKS
jgi:hypothetical protein